MQSVPDLHRIINTALVDVNYEMGAFEKIIPLSDHLPVKKALATAALSKYESISEFELDYLFLALSGKAAMDIVKVNPCISLYFLSIILEPGMLKNIYIIFKHFETWFEIYDHRIKENLHSCADHTTNFSKNI